MGQLGQLGQFWQVGQLGQLGQVGQVAGPDSSSFSTLYALRDQIRALPEVRRGAASG